MTDPRALVRRYYAYQATANCMFYAPIFFVYYQDRVGLSVAVVLWLQSYAVAVRALLDVPFGVLADRRSRRACLQASALAYLAGAVALLVQPTLAVAVLAETAFAAAAALRSGATSAFLFDALETSDRLDLYARAESRGQAFASLASGTTAVLGGLLAAADLRWPYVATAVAAAASAGIAWALGPDVRVERSEHGTRRLLGDAARAVRGPGVRWAIGLAAFTVTASHVYFYLQQPYLRAVGVPLAFFGVVFAATKAVTALTATAAHRLDARLGAGGTTAAMTIVPALGLGAMSLSGGPLGATFVLSRGLLDGLWMPLTNVYMNRLVPSRLRATMLSLQSLIARLALAGTMVLLGVGAARGGLPATLAGAAVVAAAVGAALGWALPAALRGGGLPAERRVIPEDA